MKRTLSLLIPMFLIVGCKSGEPADAKPVVAVSVQHATTSNVPLILTAPATVFGKAEAHITPRITAVVQQMLVHKGQDVSKGQLLVVLNQSDLVAQRADATAGVTNAEASLQKTQSGTIPTALTQARGDANAKSAALSLAQKVVQRREQLFRDGAISGRELDTSKAQLVQAQAEYDASKKNLDALEQHTSADDLRIAQSTLAQSRARESLASANLAFANLRSPFSGTVTDQNAFPGDLANPGSSLLTVDDLSSAVARAQVAAEDAGPVKVGQSCSFGLNKGNDGEHFGRVTIVNQAVDPARRTIEVWCEIPNADRSLKAGLFGNVRIDVGTATNAIVLPTSAVEFQEGTNKAKIYVVDEQKMAHVRDVTATPLDDSHVRVISGLSAGELVITSGEYGLPDATQVNTEGAAK